VRWRGGEADGNTERKWEVKKDIENFIGKGEEIY
jgi:hypothetical protein